MSIQATVIRRSCWVVLLWGLGTSFVFAQAAGSPIAFANQQAITTSFVKAPTLGVSSGPSQGETDWLKVEFQYGVAFPQDPNAPPGAVTPKYLDEVQFKIWIEGRDMLDPQGKPGEGIAVVLTGSVTYVNVPVGRNLYGVFYVHPNAIGRYSTDRGNRDFDNNGKFDVHMEAYVGGKIMDKIDKKKGDPDGWHVQPGIKAIPGMVYRQNQSPFLNSDVDRYPAIKLPVETAP